MRTATPAVDVRHEAVPIELVDGALRLLHTDILERGAHAQELSEWLWGAHWFPHLRDRPEITALAEALPPEWQTGVMCDPQILLQFPHVGPEPEITYHIDQEPEWADGRRYRRIVGVALSHWCAENGGLIVRTDDGPATIELSPGGAVMMAPDVLHSGGINRTGQIRYGVYFRWLGDS